MPAEKKLKVHPLPKEMQGEAIADGPVPFIFGAKADKMKQRYWIRDVTPKEEIGQRTLAGSLSEIPARRDEFQFGQVWC